MPETFTDEEDKTIDRDADWIKLVDGGKARERDLAAIDAAWKAIQENDAFRTVDGQE